MKIIVSNVDKRDQINAMSTEERLEKIWMS